MGMSGQMGAREKEALAVKAFLDWCDTESHKACPTNHLLYYACAGWKRPKVPTDGPVFVSTIKGPFVLPRYHARRNCEYLFRLYSLPVFLGGRDGPGKDRVLREPPESFIVGMESKQAALDAGYTPCPVCWFSPSALQAEWGAVEEVAGCLDKAVRMRFGRLVQQTAPTCCFEDLRTTPDGREALARQGIENGESIAFDKLPVAEIIRQNDGNPMVQDVLCIPVGRAMAYANVNNFITGMPDYFVVGPNGRAEAFFLELKSQGARLSSMQRELINHLLNAKFRVKCGRNFLEPRSFQIQDFV